MHMQNPNEPNKSPKLTTMFPLEIIEEILSYLPVRSLLRFRCVSKSLKSLISDPCFIRTHLRKIQSLIQNKQYLNEMMLFSECCRPIGCDYSEFSTMYKFQLYSIFNNAETDVTDLVSYESDEFQIVGSCDGLVLFTTMEEEKRDLILCNPASRIFKTLPDLDSDFEKSRYNVYGFGYDGETDDYKVVVIAVFFSRDDEGMHRYDNRVKVFSKRTGCWRSIEGFRNGCPDSNSNGKYVNGNLVWQVLSENDIPRFVSLDLAKETYNDIVQPECALTGCKYISGVLNGCLSATCVHNNDHVNIWLMSIGETWTKLVSARPLDQDEDDFGSLLPVHIANSGEILCEALGKRYYKDGESDLVIYNHQSGTFRYPKINGHYLFFSDLTHYFESLLSPEN